MKLNPFEHIETFIFQKKKLKVDQEEIVMRKKVSLIARNFAWVTKEVGTTLAKRIRIVFGKIVQKGTKINKGIKQEEWTNSAKFEGVEKGYVVGNVKW